MNILRIALGDFKRLTKDRMALFWMLIMPLIFAAIFGSAFGRNGNPTTWIPVIDLDHSELSALFIDQLHQDGYSIDVKGAESQVELKKKWPYGIVIPKDFAATLLKGEAIKLTMVKGTGGADRILEVQSTLTQAIVRFTTALALADVCHHAWDEASKQALKTALARPQLLTVEERTAPSLRPPPTGFYASLPGILAMFVLQMVLIYGGSTLVADRMNGQIVRLMASPLPLWQVYIGKILARVILALVQSALILCCGVFLFKISLGNHPLYLIPVVVSFAVFAGCLSMLGGILCQTEKQVSQLAIFAAMVLSALGGCWWPIEIVPDLFQTIAHFMPTYWGVHGLQTVMYFNKSYQVLLHECPVLLLFAAICLTPALFLTRRTQPR
mgnify:CR=1 FL=1